MKSMFKWIAPLLALGLIAAFNPVKADDAAAAAKVTLKGTVVDKDGKGVEGVKVNLFKAADMPQRKNNKQANGGGRQRPTAVTTATTDKDGKFELSAEPGDYSVRAEDRTAGRAQETVTLKAGEAPADITLTLKPRENKKGAAAGPNAVKPDKTTNGL